MQNRNIAVRNTGLAIGLTLLSFASFAATGDDYTGLSGAADWTNAKAAILAVAIALMGVTVLMTGTNKVLKRGRG